MATRLLEYFWVFHLINTGLLLLVWRVVLIVQHTREDGLRLLQRQLDQQQQALTHLEAALGSDLG